MDDVADIGEGEVDDDFTGADAASDQPDFGASTSATFSSSVRGRMYCPPEMTTIDPELWRQEADRVAPLLKKYEVSAKTGASATWQAHLDMLLKHVDEVIVGKAESSSVKGQQIKMTASIIGESIRQLQVQLQESLQKMVHSEKMLSSRASFTGFSLEYRGYQQVQYLHIWPYFFLILILRLFAGVGKAARAYFGSASASLGAQ